MENETIENELYDLDDGDYETGTLDSGTDIDLAQDQDLESTLNEALYQAFDNSDISDVDFIVGENRVVFKAHRVILAIRSPVWKAMLYGHMLESKKGAQIRIEDIEADVFRCILLYAYTDRIELDGLNPLLVWYAATKYCFPRLATHCIEIVQSSIASENAAVLFSQALEVGHYSLAQRIKDFIERHSEPVFLSPGFEDISLKALKELVQSDHLDIHELFVFNACIRWGNAECARNAKRDSAVTVNENPSSSSSTRTDLRTVLEPVLHDIRFPLLSMKHLGGVVQESGILKAEEMLPLLLHAANPDKNAPAPHFPHEKRIAPSPPKPRKILVLGSEAAESRLPEVVARIMAAKVKVKTMCDPDDDGSGLAGADKGKNKDKEKDDIAIGFKNVHDCIPSQSELQCASLLVWSNNNFFSHDSLTSLLSDYFLSGGGVVVATFALKIDTASGGLGGCFDEHLPVTRGRNLQHRHHHMGRVLVPDHPIMRNVQRFDGGTESHRNDITVKEGSTVIAEWDDGVPLIVVNGQANGIDSESENSNINMSFGKSTTTRGRCVVLNFFPVPKPKSSSSWDPKMSDGGILLLNSLLYAAELL